MQENGVSQTAQVAEILNRFPFAVASALVEKDKGVTYWQNNLAARITDPSMYHVVLPWASVTKAVFAYSVLIAFDKGYLAPNMDVPTLLKRNFRGIKPTGEETAFTIEHLLAHAAGFGFSGFDLLARVGVKRLYSNAGFDLLGECLYTVTGITPSQWVQATVLEPLDMLDTNMEYTADKSPAKDLQGPLTDLVKFAEELLNPSLVATTTFHQATQVCFPGLRGVLPGYGVQIDNQWGWGFELRDHKDPHWIGKEFSPRTFGHFGQSGSFLWVDPERNMAGVFLGMENFGEIHKNTWSLINSALLQNGLTI